MTGPALFPDEEKKQSGPITLFPQAGDRMKQSLRLGAQKNPDEAARVLSLASKTGLAPDVIERNLPVVEQQSSVGDLEAFREKNPATAAWISEHPNNAAVARDDLQGLSKVEQFLRAMSRNLAPLTSQGARTGRIQSQQGRIGFQQLMNDDKLDPAQSARLKDLNAQLGKTPEDMNFAETILYNGSLIYGQMSDALPEAFLAGEVGALAGGTAGAIGGSVTGPGAVLTAGAGASGGFLVGAGARMADYTFQVEAGQAYLELQQIRGKNGQALDPNVVKPAAVAVGVLNAALEMVGEAAVALPFRAAARKFAAASARDMLVRPTMRAAMADFGKHYLTALAGETGTEVMQEMTNVVAEEVTKMASHGQFSTVMNDPDQREAAIQRLSAIATQTASGMLMVGFPGASLNLAASVGQARSAAQRESFYTALGEGIKDSKTFQRLPEAMQTLVERSTKDGPIENVYMDPEVFTEYFQGKNADPRAVAKELWGSTDEYDQALQTGQAMAIPTARYARMIAPTEHNAFFARELRQTPDGLNAREADEFLKTAKEQADAQTGPAAVEALTKGIAEQIKATGRFKGPEAETLASQMGAFFTTQGERYGIDPVQLFNRYGLRILRGESEVLTVPRPDIAAAERIALQQEPAGAIAGETTLRTDAGRLPKNIKKATDQQLADEQFRLVMSNAEDSQLQVPTVNQDEGMHSSSLGRPYVGMKGGAVYATGRIASRNKSIDRIEAELKARGIDPGEAFRRSVAGEALQGSSDFNFGANVGEAFNQPPKAITASQVATEMGGMSLAQAEALNTPEGQNELARRLLKGMRWDAEKGFVSETRGASYLQKNRGRIRITPERQVSIDLLENADFSTFLHESGHFYIEVLADIAKTSDDAAEDLLTIRDWLGAKEGQSLTRDQHEQFARGMEAYMMEGIAPSIALRRAFFRFKAWLKALYSTIRSLDVQLTPEVRNVFDRMFASDAEIEAAENEAQIVPIFTTAESAGMSDIEFAAYRQTVEDAHIQSTDKLRAKLIKESLREQLEWWREARAEIRSEVESEVNQEPVYRALLILQRGENPDGTPVDNPFKMSKAGIVELRGEDFAKRLPRPYVYSREGGIHPDQSAELLGFASGDELLQSLADAPKREQVIDGETDARMKQKYGDMQLDGSIADEAKDAVLDEHREKVIRAELRALRKKAQEVKPFVDAANAENQAARTTGRQVLAGVPSEEFLRSVAQNRMANLRVRDIKPFTYWVSARKAQRAAVEALAKGDYVEAANAQQTHLLNVALYREAVRVKDDVESIQAYARKLEQPAAQKRLGKAGQEYLDQINRLLERFDFSPATNREIDRRFSLAQFIVSQEAKGLPVDIPEDMQNEAFRQPWREMRYEDLVGVRDVLKHIDHLSRLKNRLLKSLDERTFEEKEAEITQSIHDNAKKTIPRNLETRLPSDQGKRSIGGYFASLRKLGSIAREMDGFKDGGAFWDAFIRPLNGAADAESLLKVEITQKLHEVFSSAYTKADFLDMYRIRHIPSLNTSMTKQGRLMMALNWGAEDNRTKLMAGLSSSLGREITATDIQGALGSLDERDWKFVQSMWDAINDYWPQISALAKRLDGIAPEKIEAVKVQTQYGEFRGGYFPLKYDERQSLGAHRNVVATQASKTMQAGAARASTKAGSRNERVSGVRLPLRLDFGVITEHFADIALDLSHTETLIDVNRLLRSDMIEQAIRDHYGDTIYKELLSGVEDIATGDVPAINSLDKGFNWIRSGASLAALGWSFVTSALQPLGLFPAMMRVGPKWIGKGISRWVRDAASMENTAKWIFDKSPMMAGRSSTLMREISEIRNKIGGARGRAATYVDIGISKATVDKVDLQDLEDSYFWLITRMQLVADIPTWLGAYEKALEQFPDDESKAIAMADQAVLDSQGGGQIKDLASIQKGNPALKFWTNFYSYFSVVYNLHVEAFKKTDFKRPASIGRLGADLLLLSVVPTVLEMGLRKALQGPPKDENDPWWKKVSKQELGFLLGMFPGLREISGFVQGFHGYEGPAGARIFSELGKLYAQVQQGDSDKALWRSLNNSAGILLHYPALQVQRTVEGFIALSENRTRNPTALLFGPPK